MEINLVLYLFATHPQVNWSGQNIFAWKIIFKSVNIYEMIGYFV